MKKLLMGSVALLIFSASILVFQISCQKTSTAQTGSNPYVLPPATTSTLGGVIIGSGLNVSSSGVLSATQSTGGLQQLNTIIYLKSGGAFSEVWLANIDGTNQRKVPIPVSSSQSIVPGYGVRLTPDGMTVVLNVSEGGAYNIYTCGTDGSNFKKIVSDVVTLEGAY